MKNRKLYRNKEDAYFGGVASGLAEYFGIESFVFRIIFVLAAIFGGWGIIVYIVMWIFVPEKDEAEFIEYENMDNPDDESSQKNTYQKEEKNTIPNDVERKRRGSILAGLGLILIGTFFIIDNYLPKISIRELWPVILIIIGFLIIFNGFSETKRRKNEV